MASTNTLEAFSEDAEKRITVLQRHYRARTLCRSERRELQELLRERHACLAESQRLLAKHYERTLSPEERVRLHELLALRCREKETLPEYCCLNCGLPLRAEWDMGFDCKWEYDGCGKPYAPRLPSRTAVTFATHPPRQWTPDLCV